MDEREVLLALNKFKVLEISEETNFWMVRTKKGCFYEEFVQNEFVALGWNIIDKKTNTEKSNIETLKNYLSNIYDERRPQLAINKSKNFIEEMKQGDILLIPNKGTKKITFAIAGEYYEEDYDTDRELSVIAKIDDSEKIIETVKCPYKKRRKIKIIKTLDSRRIDIHLYMALTNYHGLSNLRDYAKNILDSLYSVYVYNDIFSIQVGINNEKEIDAYSLSLLTSGIIGCMQQVVDKMDIYTTINLNSPGKCSLWTSNKKEKSNDKKCFDFLKNGKGKLISLCLIVAISGGHIKVGSVEISSPGIVKTIKDIASIGVSVEKKEKEVERLEIDNFEEKYNIYKKIKDDNIDVNKFNDDLDKIMEASKKLNLGFNEATIN